MSINAAIPLLGEKTTITDASVKFKKDRKGLTHVKSATIAVVNMSTLRFFVREVTPLELSSLFNRVGVPYYHRMISQLIELMAIKESLLLYPGTPVISDCEDAVIFAKAMDPSVNVTWRSREVVELADRLATGHPAGSGHIRILPAFPTGYRPEFDYDP